MGGPSLRRCQYSRVSGRDNIGAQGYSQKSDYYRENKETFQPEQLTRLQERSEEDFFKSVDVVNDSMRVIMQEKGSNTKETGHKQKSS